MSPVTGAGSAFLVDTIDELAIAFEADLSDPEEMTRILLADTTAVRVSSIWRAPVVEGPLHRSQLEESYKQSTLRRRRVSSVRIAGLKSNARKCTGAEKPQI